MSFKKLFTFLLFIFMTLLALTCKKEPPVAPPLTSEQDTTSHNFTWTQYTFGGSGGPSSFKDVAIINDSDVWAVGTIYAIDNTMYNAAHWDGKEWGLKRISLNLYNSDCTVAGSYFGGMVSVFAFKDGNVIMTDGGDIVQWNGLSYSHLPCSNSVRTGAITKFWGISANDFYAVGATGTVLYFSGGAWTKLSSGTTIDLHDVWGTADGSEVWACGYSNDLSQSVLLQYNGSLWKTIWLQQGTSTPPYEDLVLTQWASDKFLYVGSASGIFLTPLSGNDTTRRVVALTSVPHMIRGSANNNIAVATDYKSIWHYNGSTWFEETPDELLKPLYSIAVSGNTIAAVGFDATGLNWMGEISIGRRN